MKKRILALLLVVLCLLSLSGCTFDKKELQKTKDKIVYEFNRKGKGVKEKIDETQDNLMDSAPKYDLDEKHLVEDKLTKKDPSNS